MFETVCIYCRCEVILSLECPRTLFKILDGIENVSTSMEKYLLSMHEILFTLAKKGNFTGIEKVYLFMPHSCEVSICRLPDLHVL